MKKYLLQFIIISSFLFFFHIPLSAQLIWASAIGGNGCVGDEAHGIAVDKQGNAYSVMIYQGTVDFDPGPGTYYLTSNSGWLNIAIVKFNPQGNLIWAKSFGGFSASFGNGIALDSAANIYITGSFYDTCDFDPGPGIFNLVAPATPIGGKGIFISKLDSAGNFIWAKDVAISYSCSSEAIAVDAVGNAYITGWFNGTGDFDPGAGAAILTSAGLTDIFILKLNPSGQFEWAGQYGDHFYDQGKSIALDKYGNVYTTGFFSGTVDFERDSLASYPVTATSPQSAFICKLNSNGHIIWANQFEGSSENSGHSIAVDDNGYVYTTGNFLNVTDFDPGPNTLNLTSNGSHDIFISKLDTYGNLVWAKNIGGIDFDEGQAIAVDKSGNVYTSGIFRDTVDFNPGINVFKLTAPPPGHYDQVYISKLNSNGDFVWAKHLKGNSIMKAFSIACDSAENVYTCGDFMGQADFDPEAGVCMKTSNGESDAYMIKLNGCTPSSSVINITSCDPFVLNGITYSLSGYYVQTLTNSKGCDSFLYLNAMVHPIDTGITSAGILLIASAATAYYQWINCSTNQPIPGATNRTYVPSVAGNYAVIVHEDGCTDTSACLGIYGFGVWINDHELLSNIFCSPNPNNGKFVIQSQNEFKGATIQIFDLLGRLIYRNEGLNGSQFVIDISPNPSGIYFAEVSEGIKRYLIKVLKE